MYIIGEKMDERKKIGVVVDAGHPEYSYTQNNEK